MRIMLWKPGLDDGSTGELPHIGLGILANDIKQAGHEVFLADHHFDPQAMPAEQLLRDGVDLLCISLVSQEWPLPVTQQILDLAHQLEIPVWLGGPHAHGYGDLLEEDERISKLIIGEADNAFSKILASREKRIVLGRVDQFGRPDFSLMLNHQQLENYPFFISRGCTHNCSFCAGTKAHGNRWRRQALNEELWAELDQIADNFPNVNRISIIDDAFTADMEHAKTFLREYLRRGYPYTLNVFNVRADQLDEELLQLMKQGGLESLAVGIESGDPEVFKLVGKGEKLEKIRWAIELMQQVGIVPWLNMVIGLPGDNIEAHRRSIEWVLDIPQPRIVQWLQYAPYRGTWSYDYFVKRGDIEDGFIPDLQGGRYELLPEYGNFTASDFSRDGKRLAQLEAYLRCYTPILILNDDEVQQICREHGMTQLYRDWRAKAPIREFLQNTYDAKVRKGQLKDSERIRRLQEQM